VKGSIQRYVSYEGNPLIWPGRDGSNYNVALISKDNKLKYQGDLTDVDVATALKNTFAGKDTPLAKDEGKKALTSVTKWLEEYSQKYQDAGLNYQPTILLSFTKNYNFSGKKTFDISYSKISLTIEAKDSDVLTTLKSFAKVKAFKQISITTRPVVQTIKNLKPATTCGYCKKKATLPYFFDESANLVVCPACEAGFNQPRNSEEGSTNKVLLYLNYNPKVHKKFLNELVDTNASSADNSNPGYITDVVNNYSYACSCCSYDCGSKTVNYWYLNLLEIRQNLGYSFRQVLYCEDCYNKLYVQLEVVPMEEPYISALNIDPTCFAFRKIPAQASPASSDY